MGKRYSALRSARSIFNEILYEIGLFDIRCARIPAAPHMSADGAIKALAAAAELRRWDDVDALAGTLSGVYAEVSGKAEFEALHPKLKEAMRRAHVDARHAGVVYRG